MDTTSALILANIILTAIVGIIGSTRFKCRCGAGKSLSITPKDVPATSSEPTSPAQEFPKSPQTVTMPPPAITVRPATPTPAERAPTPMVLSSGFLPMSPTRAPTPIPMV